MPVPASRSGPIVAPVPPARHLIPETGKAYEAGVKWEAVDKSLGGTLALFDIRKKNVLTADPANATAIRSRLAR